MPYRPRVSYRVQYVDESGAHQQSVLFPTYKEASIASALLHERGCRVEAIFVDNGSVPVYSTGAPPAWLWRL